MKQIKSHKHSLQILMIFLSSLLTSCRPNGLPKVFSAATIGTIPYLKEKETKISSHDFIYFNVYSDLEGNFILKDSRSYIMCYDVTSGVRFKYYPFLVLIDLATNKELEPEFTNYKNGDYGYHVKRGFKIMYKQTISYRYEDINIGKIINWMI